MSQSMLTLAKSWREEAQTIRRRYNDEKLATLCETHALELETAVRTSLDAPITLDEAARRSGYSKSHLRRLMDSGKVPNIGEKGAPRVRLGDLPYRPRRMVVDAGIKMKTAQIPAKRGVRRISLD